MQELLLWALMSGIVVGSLYSLFSLGLSLVWGVMKAINVAHAAFALVTSYIAFELFSHFSLDPFITMLFMIPSFFIIGETCYRLIISRFFKSPNSETVSVVATFGIAIVLQQIILLVFGPNVTTITLPYATEIEIMNVSITSVSILIIASALVLTGIIYFIVKKTYFGKALRACSQDAIAATFVGVNVDHIRMVTFGLSLATTAIIGTFIPTIHVISPNVHWNYLTYAFIVVIVGGLGSIIGTAVAGFMVGILQSFLSFIIPTAWVPIVIYAVLIFLLFVKPKGFFEA
jgi:branched-chain amino acid transport system permease protein